MPLNYSEGVPSVNSDRESTEPFSHSTPIFPQNPSSFPANTTDNQNDDVLCSCSATSVYTFFTNPIITLLPICTNLVIESYKVHYRCFECDGLKPDHKYVTRCRRYARGRS